MRYPSPSHLRRSRLLQPWPQNGANSRLSGLPQSGHFLAVLDMACGDGNGWVGAQADGSTELAFEGWNPARSAFNCRDHGRSRRQSRRARTGERGPPQQGPRLKAGAVAGELDQRGAPARADDLEEAEAVDRGALERLGQDGIDRPRRPSPRLFS